MTTHASFTNLEFCCRKQPATDSWMKEHSGQAHCRCKTSCHLCVGEKVSPKYCPIMYSETDHRFLIGWWHSASTKLRRHVQSAGKKALALPLTGAWVSCGWNLFILPDADDVLLEDKGECVICLEELATGDNIARLPCLCIYHKRWGFGTTRSPLLERWSGKLWEALWGGRGLLLGWPGRACVHPLGSGWGYRVYSQPMLLDHLSSFLERLVLTMLSAQPIRTEAVENDSIGVFIVNKKQNVCAKRVSFENSCGSASGTRIAIH